MKRFRIETLLGLQFRVAGMEAPTKKLGSGQVHGRMRAVGLVAVVAAMVAVMVSRGFADQVAHDHFFALTLAGCTIIFISVRSWLELPQAAGAGALLLGLQMLVLKTPLRILTASAFLGLGSLLIMVVRRIWSRGQSKEDRQLLQDATLPPLLFFLLGYFGSGPLILTSRLHPKTLDWFLYSFDQSLGTQLSFRFGQVVLPSRLLTRATIIVYFVLPIGIMFVYARQLVRERNLAMMAFMAFVVAGPLGVVFYNLVPAGGPANLFGAKFPFDPLTTEQLRQIPMAPLTIGGARNAFPSLHLAWALLIYWYAKGLSYWAKIVLLVFVGGTVCATLALGEHYFIDLVTAFPFALLVQAACALNVPFSDARRSGAVLFGALTMVAWMILLRWGLPLVWINPVVPWTLIAGTIASTLWLHARLRPVLFQAVEGDRGAVRL